MVNKSISIEDETFIRIKQIADENDKTFSTMCNVFLKRGIAYSEILESEKNKPK